LAREVNGYIVSNILQFKKYLFFSAVKIFIVFNFFKSLIAVLSLTFEYNNLKGDTLNNSFKTREHIKSKYAILSIRSCSRGNIGIPEKLYELFDKNNHAG